MKIEIEAKGPFSLSQSRDFLRGFTPGRGSADESDEGLLLSFRLDRTFEAVGVSLRQRGEKIVGDVTGTSDAAAAAHQVARILSLDHDARGFAELGRRDEIIGRLQAAKPGFRPVVFASPYEAAVWGILAQRVPMKRAADLKRGIAAQHGTAIGIGGRSMQMIPAPSALLQLKSFPGVPAVKIDRLHGIARAALDGALDAEHLCALDTEAALEELQTLPGVGPWTAQHILMRGTGPTDAMPAAEPRVPRAVQQAWALRREPSEKQLAAMMESWRPWRMWVCVLAVSALAETPAWSLRGNAGAACGAGS